MLHLILIPLRKMEVSLVDVYKLENTIINEQGMVALVCMQILHLDATEEKDQDVY